MPTYNDSRYTYEQALLDYGGLYHYGPLAGNQPNPTGILTDLDHFHIPLSGNQPAVQGIRYEEPGITYNEPVLSYNFSGSNVVTWHLTAHRILAGTQFPASGAMSWRWAPNVWPQYTTRIYDRPESTLYLTHVDTDDNTVRYRHDVGDEHDDAGDEIVYREPSPRPYTHPDDQDD